MDEARGISLMAYVSHVCPICEREQYWDMKSGITTFQCDHDESDYEADFLFVYPDNPKLIRERYSSETAKHLSIWSECNPPYTRLTVYHKQPACPIKMPSLPDDDTAWTEYNHQFMIWAIANPNIPDTIQEWNVMISVKNLLAMKSFW